MGGKVGLAGVAAQDLFSVEVLLVDDSHRKEGDEEDVALSRVCGLVLFVGCGLGKKESELGERVCVYVRRRGDRQAPTVTLASVVCGVEVKEEERSG